MPLADKRHDDGDEQTEENDDGINVHLEAHQYGIQSQHGQNAQVFVEILYGNGVSGSHEDVPPVLQERIHGNHEKSRQAADYDQEDKSDPEIAGHRHCHDDDPHGNAEGNHFHRLTQRHHTRGHHGANRDSHGHDAL